MEPTPIEAHIALSRSSDPSTSREAGEHVRETLAEKQATVYRILNMHGPMTDDALAKQCKSLVGWPTEKSTARTRRKELTDKGLVQWTGETATLPSGRQARTYRINPDRILWRAK